MWTLYALQDGVSRLRNINTISKSRGSGTKQLIETFQQIGNTKEKESKMCIISGKSYIRFTGKYKMQKNNDNNRMQIAFNDDNDLRKLPDDNYVKTISNYFPGTIISMKFYLDPKYLNKIVGKED